MGKNSFGSFRDAQDTRYEKRTVSHKLETSTISTVVTVFTVFKGVHTTFVTTLSISLMNLYSLFI